MSQKAALGRDQAGESFVAKLAQFFPHAMSVRIPVSISRVSAEKEETIIEFGTATELLFASRLSLDFEEKVRVTNPDGSLDAEASVIAVQYAGGHSAVAVRFTKQPFNWIIKSVDPARV